METIISDNAPAAIGPYSQAITHNGLVFTSGQIPLCPKSGEVVGGDVTEQARQVIDNLEAVLAAAGAGLDTVLKTTCFLADMADFAAFNAVYADRFVGKPARSCVAVKQLPRGVLVEIEAVAAIR
ncbi:MAG: Rid family detoxifying hydrolase [Planctomycetaceae bacterium]|nr:Rid family detoxifying hydrolase [Planctomycetaceae bacterium]